jgi:hypothetical protein
MPPSPPPKRPRRDRDPEESEAESEDLIDAINRRDYPSDFELEPEPKKVVPLHELDAIHRLVVDLKASLETIQRQVTVLEEVVEIVVSELLCIPRRCTKAAQNHHREKRMNSATDKHDLSGSGSNSQVIKSLRHDGKHKKQDNISLN